jgi:hypothetical protein
VDLRTIDPVIWGAAAARVVVGLVEAWVECLRSRDLRCGCGACVVCVSEIDLVASGGLLLGREVSALQAVTPMVISASAAAREENREHKILRTRDIGSPTDRH